MAQEFKPGEIVPQSGIYTITHDPAQLTQLVDAAPEGDDWLHEKVATC